MQKVRRAGGCTPGTAGFAGLWPPQNGNFPRRSRGRRDVPDRCAEGILRRGGRTAAPRQTPRRAVQHGRQGSGAGGGHLPRCAGCSSRCCATGTLRQRDGQGRKRHRIARCQRGICRPRLPGRRQPCATRRSRRNDRGRGYRHCAGLADGGAGYRTGRRRQHRNPAGRFRLRHGDGPKALAFVQKISAALLAAGTAVAAF